MIEEIKALARRQLAEHGPGAVSLRAIARELGTASSALFRYFPSHHDLITALIVDAYNALADALTAAIAPLPAAEYAQRWYALSRAYRHWALHDTPGFALTHGTPMPGYQAPADITGPPAARALHLALHEYTAAVHAGAADPARTHIPPDLQPGPLLTSLLASQEQHYEPWHAAIVLNARACLIGHLTQEIFGSLPALITDTTTLYHAHIHGSMLAMGYHPALISEL
jgi:AcrR family transcriptional regulator